MGRAPAAGGATAFRFTQREVLEMEKALESSRGSTPARAVVLSLAENFSNSEERAGQKPIQWKQVWNWFQNRRHSQKAKIARSPEKLKAVAVVPDQQPKVPAPSGAVPSGARSRSDSQQMEFEAKSARDGAWYDVSTFISHRLAASGDPEVRVRFAGFGSEEDEWVNVRSAVRQRSLPCEASECVAVLPGDLILCFQEGNEQALYFDADILDVQRRRHDVRGCRCRFWVRYRHDQSEEVVPLRKVCRRPETEYRLLKLQSYGKNPVMVPDVQQQPAASKPDPPPSAPVADFTSPATSSTVPLGSEIVQPTSSQPASSQPASSQPASSQPASSTVATVPSTVMPTVEPSPPMGLSAEPEGGSAVPAPVTWAPAGVSPLSQDGPVVAEGFPAPVVTTASAAVSSTPVQPTIEPGTGEPGTGEPGGEPGTGISATESERNLGVPPQATASQPVVDTTQQTGTEGTSVVGQELPVAFISEQAKQLSVHEEPSLKAQPEMFDSEVESIVVLDKADLEGMRKP